MSLKYLFKATFTDGSTFEQPADDKSLLEDNRSSFFDFLQESASKQLKTFELKENTRLFPTTYLVDLTDGHFEINGAKIIATPEQNLTKSPQEYRLVYFREVKQFASVSAYMRKEGTGLIPVLDNNLENGHTEIVFFIGWQCTIAKKNYQQLIGIK